MNDIDYFIDACVNNQSDEVASIIDEYPSIIFQKNSKGWTGLIVSCFHNHIELAKFLVAKGANVNDCNTKGTSVLMYAKTPVIQRGCSTELLAYLLQEGAKINHKDSFNKTILDYCIELNAIELSGWLVEKGAKTSES